ncbi:regulator of G-protein signaling 22 isoform X1 [Lingula anatina]|uniref:Regulator of G-protein signaling 22 isoform X1 n=1 Tax=Lingula anatina TaxID=7574 RepID=A0A2R2MTF6_LINAN|nr:regulator of G-protein signaling 22 isoform X1 [Lingula anatina]|eukprot:XP_023933546.1 regulator of G-protein signaling 22 isoform X1 [Lingula anatina]
MTPPPEVDESESLLKNCFVCMGNASTTDTDAWVSQAKIAHDTNVTVSGEIRPSSATTSFKSPRRPTSGRPVSAFSSVDSYRNTDSGLGMSSPSKLGSIYGSGYHIEGIPDVENEDDLDDEIQSSKLFDDSSKPHTPRPSDVVCYIDESMTSYRSRGPAFYTNKPNTDSQSRHQDGDSQLIYDTKSVGRSDDEDSSFSEFPRSETPDSETSLDLTAIQDLDEYADVVVATALKYSFASAIGKDPARIAQLPQIKKLFPSERYIDTTREKLKEIYLDAKPVPFLHQTPKQQDTMGNSENTVSNNKLASPPAQSINAKEDKAKKPVKTKDGGYDSEDSLLGSDDDYEESDTMFRKHKKQKSFGLNTKKGIEEFRKFLKGTQGEKNLNLWLDIDRGRLLPIDDQEEIQMYLAAMRERYFKHGSVMELSQAVKLALKLTRPECWTLEKLFSVQEKIAEPLVCYWAPRFLLKQTVKYHPEKNKLYHHQKLLQPVPNVPYPNPPTMTLLPLRPKSCAPRCKPVETTSTAPPQPVENVPSVPPVQSTTSPLVGLKRVYSIPEHFQPYIPSISKAKKDLVNSKEIQEASEKKSKKKELITPTLVLDSGRPDSAISERSSLPSRPKTARSSNWETQSNASDKSTKRPKSADTSSKKSTHDQSRRSSTSSIFEGGRRMEGLLQALNCEKQAGMFLKRYLEKSGNQLWINCISFWKEVQEYHQTFYEDVIDPFALSKKAQHLNSQFIVEGSPFNIGCNSDMRKQINRQIDPPFEELFDAAEEYVLHVLYVAWMQMKVNDQETYKKIELIEVKRQLETRSKYVITLQKRGLIREFEKSAYEKELVDEEPTEGYQDPVYDESLWEKIPEEFRDFSLSNLVYNRVELEEFRLFLSDNYASVDLMCWIDMEAFRRIPHEDTKRRDMKAKEIKTKYLTKKYFFGPNSPAGKEGQNKIMESCGGWGKLLEDRPPNELVLEAQKYVQDRLEKKWLPMFLATEEFADRQRPQSSMSDVVDDVMSQRKKKNQAVWKMLESKWVSSSKEIIGFRKALLNPVTCLQFRKFVSLKGEFLENDVLFWLEVQKYKDMYHVHMDDSLIQQKISTIINCFLDSQIPPSIQIDVPTEQAERILERRRELGPYIFRETQLTVFRVLFQHWPDFQNYRSNISESKLVPTLDRLKKRARAKEMKKQRELEELKEKEAARRRALGLPPEGEEGEDDEEEAYDPFASLKPKGKDEGEEEAVERDNGKVSWTYSQYMSAFAEEDVLNNTDESTFSSLADAASLLDVSLFGDSDKDSRKKKTRKESVDKSQQTDQEKAKLPPSGSEGATGSKPGSARPGSRPASGQAAGKPQGQTAEHTPSPPGSRPTSSSRKARVMSPKEREPAVKSVTYIEEKQKVRLGRTIPPLVRK